MAFLAPLIPLMTAAAAGFSIYQGVTSMNRQGKDDISAQPPAPIAPPEVPTPMDAEADAAAEVKKKRKISALTGGTTDMTRGKALVSESSIGRKSLLGA